MKFTLNRINQSCVTLRVEDITMGEKAFVRLKNLFTNDFPLTLNVYTEVTGNSRYIIQCAKDTLVGQEFYLSQEAILTELEKQIHLYLASELLRTVKNLTDLKVKEMYHELAKKPNEEVKVSAVDMARYLTCPFLEWDKRNVSFKLVNQEKPYIILLIEDNAFIW